MLDHAFLDVVSVLRSSFADALLDRERLEERLQFDILLGDLSWEASFTLPGEGSPPRVRADLSVDWPTWSQTSYRSWVMGDPGEEPPELGIELVVRIQGLAGTPDLARIAGVLPDESPPIGTETLTRSAPTVEQSYEADLSSGGFSVEFVYEGAYDLTVDVLADRDALAAGFSGLGRWVASTLVRLADLRLAYREDSPT